MSNRCALDVQSAVIIARLRLEDDQQPRAAVLFLDLDGLIAISDLLGHAAGDRLLRDVAARLSTIIRTEDAIARYGGDEFVAVLSGVDHAEARALAERARAAVAAPFE